MKYAIKGLEKSKTIKDIKVNEGKNIEVKYLNGNSDIIEYTEENLKKVIETMTTQAKCFVKCFGDIHLLFAAALACCFWMLSIPGMIFLVLGDAILPIAFLVMAAISGCGFLICKSIENYHQKYTLYIENNFQEVINKYKEISND